MFKKMTTFRSAERRRGRDRRKTIDPRYRNHVFPEFVDRRKRNRRKPVYDNISPLVKEHISRPWVTVIGIIVTVFVMWVSVLANTTVDARLLNRKKGNLCTEQIIPLMFILK